MTRIQRKADRLYLKWEKVWMDIKTMQDSCPHKNATKEYKSNSGNYDPMADQYWINFYCPECRKHWTTEQ